MKEIKLKLKRRMRLFFIKLVWGGVPKWMEDYNDLTTNGERSSDRMPLGTRPGDMFLDANRCSDNEKWIKYQEEMGKYNS